MVKIGSVELTLEEAKRLFDEGRYIVTFSKIYKIVPRGNTFYGKSVHTGHGMTRRGRFYAMTAETVNNVFGLQLA